MFISDHKSSEFTPNKKVLQQISANNTDRNRNNQRIIISPYGKQAEQNS